MWHLYARRHLICCQQWPKGVVNLINKQFRKAVIDDCLPDQVRVDHSHEFYLTLFGQELLAFLRTNTQRDPYRQTQSKKVIKVYDCDLIWICLPLTATKALNVAQAFLLEVLHLSLNGSKKWKKYKEEEEGRSGHPLPILLFFCSCSNFHAITLA